MGLSTAFYTVDGEIIGESSNGVRLDYLTDALGSVTAKVSQAGAVASSARYKPYGDKLAGSDYTFGWVGSFGYRKAVSGPYIRARHYSELNGSWRSIDRLWPSQLAYTYAESSPTFKVDEMGTAPHRKLYRYKFGDCGFAEVIWTFSCDPGDTGWLVQKIDNTYDREYCDHQSIPGCVPNPYYEAWRVVKGKVYALNDKLKWVDSKETDAWRKGKFDCGYGNTSTYGELMFYKDKLAANDNGYFLDYEWLRTNHFTDMVRCANGLPSTSIAPPKFSGTQPAYLYVAYKCCSNKSCQLPVCDKCSMKTEGPCGDPHYYLSSKR